MARFYGGRSRRRFSFGGLLLGAVWISAGGCASGDAASMSGEGGTNAADSSGRGGAASNAPAKGMVATAGAATAAIPDEQDNNVDFEAPQSSLRYVYATNADRDSVAVIDASTLSIHVVNTGDQPRFLRTIPGKDAALLVDVGARELAYIETTDGKSAVSYFRDLPSANVVAVAPDGKHAVAYYDVTQMQGGRFETLQDVSVVTFDVLGPVATRMTVGFKPRKITFAGGTTLATSAYIVTDDGVSILDFAKIDAQRKASIADTVPVFDALEQKGADISVTPDGKFAVGRLDGTTSVRLVELQTGQVRTLDLAAFLPAPAAPNRDGIGNGAGGSAGSAGGGGLVAAAGTSGVTTGNGSAGLSNPSSIAGNAGIPVALGESGAAGTGPAGGTVTKDRAAGGGSSQISTNDEPPAEAPNVTDLALSPDGTFALAVSRNRGVWLRIPIPQGFSDPGTIVKQSIANVVVGSAAISPNGHWAVLHTNVVETERRVVIVDLTNTIQPRTLDLTKSVRGIAFSSSGDQAYVLHRKSNGNPSDSGLSPEEVLDRSYGYTLIDLTRAFRKLMITDSEPNLSVTIPKAPYAFLSFLGESTTVHRLDMESLQVNPIVLGSVPISIGVVPGAQRVFVNQKYTDGRLTFIDWSSLDTRTVTGYELNSKIRE